MQERGTEHTDATENPHSGSNDTTSQPDDRPSAATVTEAASNVWVPRTVSRRLISGFAASRPGVRCSRSTIPRRGAPHVPMAQMPLTAKGHPAGALGHLPGDQARGTDAVHDGSADAIWCRTRGCCRRRSWRSGSTWPG